MDHECRLGRQRIDAPDGLLEGAERVGVGRLVESDVTVADLQERQPARLLRHGGVDDAKRAGHAAGDGPEDAGAGPGHAFEHFAPAHALAAGILTAVAVLMVFAHRLSPRSRSGFPRSQIARWLALFPMAEDFLAGPYRANGAGATAAGGIAVRGRARRCKGRSAIGCDCAAQKSSTAAAAAAPISDRRSGLDISVSSWRLMIEPASNSTAGMRVRRNTTS